MFITNERLILPISITVDKVEVKAVNNFKLLGITLDSRLKLEKTFYIFVNQLFKIYTVVIIKSILRKKVLF